MKYLKKYIDKTVNLIISNYFLQCLLVIFFIVCGYIFILLNSANHIFKNTCLFKNATGIPCPGCGMSRASVFLINGQFINAFKMNALIYIVTLIVLVIFGVLIVDIMSNKQNFRKITKFKFSFKYQIIIFIVIILNWINNIINNI